MKYAQNSKRTHRSEIKNLKHVTRAVGQVTTIKFKLGDYPETFVPCVFLVHVLVLEKFTKKWVLMPRIIKPLPQKQLENADLKPYTLFDEECFF